MEAATEEVDPQQSTPPQQPPPPEEDQPSAEDDEVEEEPEGTCGGGGDDDELMLKAQKFMDMITSSPDNPNPKVLHALASVLETEEARYMEATGYSSLSNVRASHSIGRLGTIVRDNDEFFELISSKFLSESGYTASVQAATLRLLLSCSLSWVYPHVFEEYVLDNIREWVIDEGDRYCGVDSTWKPAVGEDKPSDFDMRRVYSTGILAVCLAGAGQIVEDALTSGLSAKLMRYLRTRVLGETSSRSSPDAGQLALSKSTSILCGRGREEGRGRTRQTFGVTSVDETRVLQNGPLVEQILERDRDKDLSKPRNGEEHWLKQDHPDDLDRDVDNTDADCEWENLRHYPDTHDGRFKGSNRNMSGRWLQSVGRARSDEGALEAEQPVISLVSGSQLGQGRSIMDHSLITNLEGKQALGAGTCSHVTDIGVDDDESFPEYRVGSKDISHLVRSAVRAAEAEARTANAPAEAVKAAGEAAADLVKTAALDEFRAKNDEGAAFLAASRAASTVIDAANAIEVSRNFISQDTNLSNACGTEKEVKDDVVDFFIPDNHSLAKQREFFCIQCLEILGEYLEVLGPVLHEKGVDVCLALLQQYYGPKDDRDIVLLPDVLKLICALAAHKKFAESFVDMGGMQKLLAVPRVAQTYLGLSSCLFTIGSLQGVMEHICAPPSDIVHEVVKLGLQLLECPQDQARKNVALFFTAAFVFRAIIEAFDDQDGLQKLLGILHDAASVRSGVNNATMGSASGSLRNDRSNAEVLTSSEKQIAYHACVALRQYFRARLLLLVDSIRPNKSSRSTARSIPSSRAAYKPLDLSNEAVDAVLLQIQKDRKLGPAFVRARWPAVDEFLLRNGHITMLELCQAPATNEQYLQDLPQYALGVLHIITLVPNSRKSIVDVKLSGGRAGISVILDAANISSILDPEIVQQALNVLINLVCPPPSISNKPPPAQNQQSLPHFTGPGVESRDRNAERSVSDRAVSITSQNEMRDRNGEPGSVDRGASLNSLQSPVATVASGLVGDRRISLGAGAGGAGLAAQLEQGYRQAREAVKTNNGIKVLLQLLQPRPGSSYMTILPATFDCLRALACRVLLGLARDEEYAHILRRLPVGKRLSELIRDIGGHTLGTEQNRWQTELTQLAIELIAIVTNSVRASTALATDAATPTLRRIERAAIAAATPIAYDSRELLQLIHEHLQGCGLGEAAAMLLKEAQLTPLPSLAAPSSLPHHTCSQEAPAVPIQWPSSRAPVGFPAYKPKIMARDEDPQRCDSIASLKKKPLIFASSVSKSRKASSGAIETPVVSATKSNTDAETQAKTPLALPIKRKTMDMKENGPTSSVKRLNAAGEHGLRSPSFQTPCSSRRTDLLIDSAKLCSPPSSFKEHYGRSALHTGQADTLDDHKCNDTPVGLSQQGLLGDLPGNAERLTLDSIVSQFLKQQHRQCPAPITTLPPLSLLQSHACPEPRRNREAPTNVTARLSTRECRRMYGGIYGNRRDRQFVYSRFRPWRTCRDDAAALFTCISFLGDSSQIAVGSHSGELKIFDTASNNVLESCMSHPFPVLRVQSHVSNGTQLVLSSSPYDVRLWDASLISGGPLNQFEDCRAATFCNSGTRFAALPRDPSRREIRVYDVQTYQLDQVLLDSSLLSGRGLVNSLVHFSPSDELLLWHGVLWDRRVGGAVHRFDQFTEYGGGGFHPAGNEVIINSEVWDLRKLRILRSVPSLDQTSITFNGRGDVIYATMRLNPLELPNPNRLKKHPLYGSFRTLDAVNYSDIAKVPINDPVILDLATEPSDSFVGLISKDDEADLFSCARIYEIGRRRLTDDDSDPDNNGETEEDEEDDDDDDEATEALLGAHLDGDSDDMSNDSSSDGDDGDEDDGGFIMDAVGLDGGGGVLEIVTDIDGDDDSDMLGSGGSDDEDFADGFGF